MTKTSAITSLRRSFILKVVRACDERFGSETEFPGEYESVVDHLLDEGHITINTPIGEAARQVGAWMNF